MSSQNGHGNGARSSVKLNGVFTKDDLMELLREDDLKFEFDVPDGDDGVPLILRGVRDSVDWRELKGTTELCVFTAKGKPHELWLYQSADIAREAGLRMRTLSSEELPQMVARFFLTKLVPAKARDRRELAKAAEKAETAELACA